MTIEEVASLGEEPVETHINDEVFYQAGDLMIPTRPDSRIDMRQTTDEKMKLRTRRTRERMIPWRGFDELMRVALLSTLPEEEWERYQCEFERKTG